MAMGEEGAADSCRRMTSTNVILAAEEPASNPAIALRDSED
jgi:hypothetical protein